MQNFFQVNNLKTYFYQDGQVIKAVDNVSFQLKKGEIIGVVGESGCGKTVMSLSIMKLISFPPGKIAGGSILLHDENLVMASEKRMQEVRGNIISMIFQEPMTCLNPLHTIGKQLSEPLMLHKHMSKKDALEKCKELLEQVGISSPAERLGEYPFQLSGGLRQRVMIAMAISCNPLLLIADEPTTALDVTIQAQILNLIKKINKNRNISVIFITHDLAVIAGFVDRVIVMYAGVIVEISDVKTLFKSPKHPYTKGLLNSIPRMGQYKYNNRNQIEYLPTIKGSITDYTNNHTNTGCRFYTRCPQAKPQCQIKEPDLLRIHNNQSVRCILYQNDRIDQEK